MNKTRWAYFAVRVAVVSLCVGVMEGAEAKLYVQLGHSEGVISVAFSPDGRWALTGSRDKTARLWEVATGKEIRRLQGHSDDVTSVSFSPGGRWALTGSKDKTARLWDLATGKEIRRLQGHSGDVTSVAFSPDGRWALTGSKEISTRVGEQDNTARLWEVATGKEIQRLEVPWGVTSVAFSPDGRRVLTGGSDFDNGGTARLWDMETSKEVQRFVVHSDDDVTSVAFSPDGRRVLTGGGGKTAQLWDVETGKELQRFAGHSGRVNSVAFSPDGRRVLTGSLDHTARLWDVETAKELQRFVGHSTNDVTSVAFSPDGRRVLTGSWDWTARLWDVKTGKELQRFEGQSDRVNSVTFSPDGRWALTGSDDQTAQVWELTTGGGIRRLRGHSSRVFSVAVSPDGRWALTGGVGDLLSHDKDNTARLWDVETGKDIQHLEGHGSIVDSVAFSPDGRWALTGSWDNSARLWDLASGKEIRRFEGHSGAISTVTSVAFSPDGRQALTSSDHSARLWDLESGKEIRRFEEHSGAISTVTSVAFSPNGHRVLTGSEDYTAELTDHTAKLWDVETGKELQRFEGHSDRVNSVAFSPDGRRVLTGSEDHTARLWDVETGKELQRFEGHSAEVSSVAFSPDGHNVLTGSWDGTTRLWDAASGRWLATLVSFRQGGWAVVDPDGRFDTSNLDGGAPLHWIVDDDPMRPLPLAIFMRDYYTPRLLARILGGEKLPPLPNIAQLNRVQPRVETPVVESSPTDPDRVRVRVKVAQRTEGGRSSGAQDLRIFRDGQLVKFQEGPLKDGEYVFDGIRLPAAGSVEFTAYAFNSDRVKSETAPAAFKRPGARAAPQPKTFVINIGVNRNRAAGCDLHYAVSDATNLGDALKNRLPSIQRQLLVSADDAHLDGASKDSIRAALAAVASQATPDDIFVLSFSGHGYTDKQGVFYLFPSDLKGSCADVDTQLKTSAISSDELAEWVRPIDAGEMVMILDACYSAASVESGEFKPGPMGNHGLGQLAYDKRIRILAASQSTQAAAETPWLGMGLLSFALTKDGLEAGEADWQPKDGKIWLREWLAYGVERVPKLYAALQRGNIEEFRNAARGFGLTARAEEYKDKSLQTPALFDFRRDDQPGIRLK